MNTVKESLPSQSSLSFQKVKNSKDEEKVEWAPFMAIEKFTARRYQKDPQQSQKLNLDLKDPFIKRGQYEPG